MRYRSWIGLICWGVAVAGLAACDAQGTEDDPPEDTVDPRVEIEQHVQTFLQEAGQRGRTQTLYRPAELQIIIQQNVVQGGDELCGFGGANPTTAQPEILIATNAGCWDRPSTDREILVFHELGHALLGRSHRDDTLPNGLRASIMTGDSVFGLYSETRADRRAYYVDELFDPATPVPAWGVR